MRSLLTLAAVLALGALIALLIVKPLVPGSAFGFGLGVLYMLIVAMLLNSWADRSIG